MRFFYFIAFAMTLLPLTGMAWNPEAYISSFKEKKYKTIDDALKALPEEVRSSFTLIYEGHGLRGTTYQTPGAVLFTRTGDFFLTFGDESQKLGNELEIAHVVGSKTTLYAIEFPKEGQEGSIKVTKNPSKCVRCHTEDPMLIWQSYQNLSARKGDPNSAFGGLYDVRSWFGIYGSFDDALSKGALNDAIMGKEIDQFLKFKKKMPDLPRYNLLRPLSYENLQALGEPFFDAQFSPYNPNFKDPRLLMRPNALISFFTALTNADRVTRKMMKNENFQSLRFYSIYQLMSCAPSNLDALSSPEKDQLKLILGKLVEKKKIPQAMKVTLSKNPLGLHTFLALLDLEVRDFKPNTQDIYYRSSELPFYDDGLVNEGGDAEVIFNSISRRAASQIFHQLFKKEKLESIRSKVRDYSVAEDVQNIEHFKSSKSSMDLLRAIDSKGMHLDVAWGQTQGLCLDLLKLQLNQKL